MACLDLELGARGAGSGPLVADDGVFRSQASSLSAAGGATCTWDHMLFTGSLLLLLLLPAGHDDAAVAESPYHIGFIWQSDISHRT